ncbi:glycerol-3-phosphate dehydrogenase/oxidase [Brevibacillus choshinensis]|uniref:glycerol-3-phosphate dehydrogenase/oxidase n=1 Tax=Brevibacillus choshinensis TaxID=54911 RepID=UPI000A954BD9|nr:glycerol-3-phosphate dehydrogenase/oxidase [Brevibacillus choshinensis]
MGVRNSFSATDREPCLKKMAEQQLDLLIVGGGITGAGIAWDASLRGLNVGLVEKKDFGWGTSSRSTKLIHGGLRYLKQGEISLVKEVGKERALLYHLAPHLVHPLKMLLPMYKGGSLGPVSTSIGLWLYDWLAGVTKHERRTMLSTSITATHEPLLSKDGMLGGGMYYEYMTDDARLTLEIMRSALIEGALACNYTEVTRFYYVEGRIEGAYVTDCCSGKEYLLKAKKIVNATGPWVDNLRELDKSKRGKRLHLTKGVHIVIPYERMPIKQSLYFDTSDGRMVFAIPRGEIVYVGTTDTAYQDNIEHPIASTGDRDYLLDAVNKLCPTLKLTREDVKSSWVGLRPLIYQEGKGPSELSRKDEIFLSPSGLITIAGGKLTGFRKMAEKVVNLVCKQLRKEEQLNFGPCITDNSPILGSGGHGPDGFRIQINTLQQKASELGVPQTQTKRWLFTYGCSTNEIFTNLQVEGRSKNSSPTEQELIGAELKYAWEREMICRSDDFLIRRTGLLFFYPELFIAYLHQTIQFLAEKQHWTEQEKGEEQKRMMQLYSEALFTSNSK